MGLVYLPILLDFYGFHVGKYTILMDPMGYLPPSKSTTIIDISIYYYHI